MNNDKEFVSQRDLSSIIEDFIVKTDGLTFQKPGVGEIEIFQKSDAKRIRIKLSDLVDVLLRKDPEGKDFVQVNFTSGKKILLTDQLVGFKPATVGALDVAKLPKVVTTLDLLSVFEAIEESAASAEGRSEDMDTLKKVFVSILQGGEDVGFDLSTEKLWLKRLPVGSVPKASA